MKKIIVLALALTTLVTTGFSRNKDEINKEVLYSFSQTFSNAKDVKWEAKKDFIRAKFTIEGQTMYAYYKETGQQIALTRNILTTQLPLELATSLRAKYDSFWLADLFEVSADGVTTYYATIRNGSHIIVLKSDAFGWSTFRRQKV